MSGLERRGFWFLVGAICMALFIWHIPRVRVAVDRTTSKVVQFKEEVA